MAKICVLLVGAGGMLFLHRNLMSLLPEKSVIGSDSVQSLINTCGMNVNGLAVKLSGNETVPSTVLSG